MSPDSRIHSSVPKLTEYHFGIQYSLSDMADERPEEPYMLADKQAMS